MSGCPHRDIRFCPLYLGMHIPHGPSCFDDQIDGGGCAVDRGASYEALVGTMMAKHPGVVEQCRWNEQAAQMRAQRERNMRVNGIH